MDTSNQYEIIVAAAGRLQRELAHSAPVLAESTLAWMQQLAGTSAVANYFTHPVAFPILLLPWWAEEAIAGRVDPALQESLIVSTMSGYYYIRLIDNLMDGDATIERQILPAINFFHTRFHGLYQRFFDAAHPFWEFFDQVWMASAEATARDALLADVDHRLFVEVAARKTCAAKIPVAAVCHHHERADMIAPWSQFIDVFGCWHQMWNDLFGWHADAAYQRSTYLLSEARRRMTPGEPLVAWFIREGFAWGLEQLSGWMAELKQIAGRLGSPALAAYLERRDMMVREHYEAAQEGLHNAAQLLKLLR
ncbi:MAG: hypothetical protein KatS3mg057_3041 [Herpetosiphonaceae bacterium]|nr:MAG: hypothetical protein KatS3mg057_3041 [Herpetosiphonaceae bacterium]